MRTLRLAALVLAALGAAHGFLPHLDERLANLRSQRQDLERKMAAIGDQQRVNPVDETALCSTHGTHSCACDFGYKGPNCGVPIDFCKAPTHLAGEATIGDICDVHGKCVSLAGRGAKCVCNFGWSGPLCETPVPGKISVAKRCALYSTPAVPKDVPIGCPDGQRCLSDRLNCGFTKNCSNPIGWCVPNPAADALERELREQEHLATLPPPLVGFPGECSGHGNGSCACDPGYTGASCENTIDFCNGSCASIGISGPLKAVCGPHGLCHSQPSGLTCNCKPGWTGAYCDQPLPAAVTIASRCRLYRGSASPTNITSCPGGQRCLSDRLNCGFVKDCTDPIGWCLPRGAGN